jgi:hypothetical protein
MITPEDSKDLWSDGDWNFAGLVGEKSGQISQKKNTTAV